MILSSILIAETTFSSPDSFMILTPWVFLPAILISLTGHLITLPLSVDSIISSSSETTSVEVTFPFLFEFTIPIIPFPPLLVTLKSVNGVLLPYPFSVIERICLL